MDNFSPFSSFFKIFNWRIITHCVAFCHTATWTIGTHMSLPSHDPPCPTPSHPIPRLPQSPGIWAPVFPTADSYWLLNFTYSDVYVSSVMPCSRPSLSFPTVSKVYSRSSLRFTEHLHGRKRDFTHSLPLTGFLSFLTMWTCGTCLATDEPKLVV